MTRSGWIGALVAFALAGAAPAMAGTFTLLGYLSVSDEWSIANAASDDGSVIVGMSGAFDPEAFRWESGTMTALGRLPGDDTSEATALSADGSVVVGYSGGPDGQGYFLTAFRWEDTPSCEPGGAGNPCMFGMGVLDGLSDSVASGVSADGTIVVGQSSSTSFVHGFVWEDTPSCDPLGAGNPCMASLDGLPGSVTESDTSGISADGKVIVGVGTGDTSFDTVAVTWDTNLDVSPLGNVPTDGTYEAEAASTDGSVVVGLATNTGANGGLEAFRWRIDATCDPESVSNDCMQGLGDLDGGEYDSIAYDVSATGLLVVGTANFDGIATGDVDGDGFGEGRAFLWDPVNGMRDLNTVVTGEGTNLAGWTLINAYGISADGTTIVGSAMNSSGDEQAFSVTQAVPEPDVVVLLGIGTCALLVSASRRAAQAPTPPARRTPSRHTSSISS